MKAKNRKYIIYSIVLLVILGLSVGFSTLQKTLLIDDFIFNVRLQIDTRVSASLVSKTGGDAISNFEDYNVSKIYGNATFPTTSSYVLYKVDLTNYGNVKTGLLNITSNTSGISYSICDSNGNNCSNNPKTAVCNGNNCTLGSTKEIYVKVTSSSTGTKSIDLDLDFQPYHNISYENFNENINSFETEIMETDTYEITLTSNVEEVEVNGRGTASYNKNTHKLTISGVESDITINAKYLITDLAQTSYTGRDPDNYVSFNKGLFRIITKENINDGYGNTELRTKIVSNSSIGSNPYASNYNVTSFSTASISGVLEVYTRGISNESAQLIDTAQWTEDYVNNAGLISKTDAQNNISWWNSDQFTIELIPNGTSFLHKDSIIASNNNSKTKLVSQKNDDLLAAVPSTLYPIKAWGIASGSVGEILVNISLATYPSFYLHKDVLVVGGTGTSTNPYLLDIKGDSLKTNPTIITGKTVTVTGSNQDIITVSNRIGTPYFGTTVLNESNYRTDGEAGVPRRSAVGTYTFYYYIPAVDGYKPRAGSVTARINGITHRINYTKGENISEIGKTSDSCTTTGTSLTCTVTLPTITPNAGWENGRWTDGRYNYNPGTSYTLNSSNSGGTLSSVVTGKTFTATIYYYNGSGTSSTTASCTVTSGSSCSFIRPNAVVNSTGVYNGGFLGLAGSMNTMAQSNSVLSDDTTYYALYTKNVTNYYYDGTSYTSRTLNRNEYFSTVSTLVSKLAIDDSTASNYSGENGVGNSTWLGLSTSNDTTAEYNSVELAASSTVTTLYTIYQFSIEYQKGVNVSGIGATGGTCKVTSQNSCSVTLPSITPNTGYESVGWSSTSGALTGIPAGQSYSISVNSNTLYANAVGAIYTATFYYYDGNNINTATSSCTVSNVEGNCTVTVPSVVQNSTGPYNGTFNTASATSTMEPISLTINNNTSKFYANYKTSVTRYYYSSGYKTNTIYRNEYFINDSTMSSVLTTSDVGTTNYTTSRGPGSSNWLGLSTAQDTTIEYNSVSNAAQSTNTTFYTVYQFIVNFEKGTNVDSIGSSSSSCNVTTSNTSCTVIFPSITPNIGYTSVGWSMTNGDTIGEAALTTYTVTNNNRVFYANAIAANYLNTTTNDTYMTLSEALTAVSSNQTIKVLQNTTETTQATLSNTKTGVTLDLNNKTVTSSASECITNNGTITVSSGTLNCTSGTAITNAGTLTITSATIRGTYGISNGTNKTLNINGTSTQIVGTVYDGITTYGNVNVANGSISGNRYGIETLSSTVGSTTYYGNVYLTGGSISGIECGVKVASSSTLQLGTNDGNVSTTTPSIQATGTNGNYGIYMDSLSKLYFYDGVIKSSSGEGYSIYFSSEWYGVTVATNYADLCILNKETSNGIESATVVMGNYVVVSTNKGYKTLRSALSYIYEGNKTNQTIKVLQDVTETTEAIVYSNGTKLDLNGHTITSSASPAIRVDDGSLDVYNSSSTPGVIEGSGRYTIYNEDIFTTNQTDSTNNVIIRNTSTAANSRVLYNDSNSSATLNDNTTITFTNPLAASTTRYLIQSSGTSLTIDGANLINNVDSSTYNAGISGNVTMTSGTITTTGISINGGGTITGGTITSNVNCIEGSSIITIGADDGNINASSPVIQSLGTSGTYAVTNSSLYSPTFNFYDGILKSSSGTGYSTNIGAYDVPAGYAMHKTTSDGIETAFLEAAIHNYQNTTTNIYYETLRVAFTRVESNQTIKVLQNTPETSSSVSLASGKTGVKLDLNGKTIIGIITNYGDLDIYSSSGDGVIEGTNWYILGNAGTLTINGTSNANNVTIRSTSTSYSSSSVVLYNNSTSGSIVLNTNAIIQFTTSISTTRYLVENTGSLTIAGATLNNNATTSTNNRGINLSNASATVTMTSGTINTAGYIIYNGSSTSSSAVTISGGTLRSSNSYGIYNNASGTINISGGDISSNSYNIYNNSSGAVNITGGTIGGSYGAINTAAGSILMTGGTINVSYRGIQNSATGTVTLGTNDSNVSTTSPVIQVTGTSSRYGLYNTDGGTFNFFDGIIKSSSRTGYSIYGDVTNVPSNYCVQRTVDTNEEIAILDVAFYKNLTTGTYYHSLSEAFSKVDSNEIIQVLANVNETSPSYIGSGKLGVKLDLNGKTITLDDSNIQNAGDLDIYNTSSSIGKIEGGSSYVLYNAGTLTLNKTSSTNKIIIDKIVTGTYRTEPIYNDSGTFICNNNVEIIVSVSNISAIFNKGTLTINGGTITGSQYGIRNMGIATITGGTITGQSDAICNIGDYNTVVLAINGSGASIIGTNGAGIINSASLIITNGTITGATSGVSNTTSTVGSTYYSGIATITGGTITGKSAILVSSGTVTLGTDDSTVSTTSPIIQGIGNTNNGVSISTSAIFNFYDGVIKSAGGTDKAIDGTVANIPNDYEIHKETTNGVESAYLVEENSSSLKAGDSGDENSYYLGTTILKKNIESIAFTNSITGHTANGTNCFDVSVGNNGSVLVWSTDNDSDGLYELTFGSSSGTVSASSGNNLFSYLTNLASINGMQYFDTSKVTDLSYMFYGCSSLTSINVSNFNTTNVTTLEKMFYNCTNLSNITGLANFNTAKVESLYGLFWNCENLITINGLANWNTSNVTTMRGVFGLDTNKEKVGNPVIDYSFVANWNTSKVTEMTGMFQNTNIASYVPFTNWDVSKVTLFKNMFNQTLNSTVTSLHGLEKWNTSSATEMFMMFAHNVSLTDASAIKNWDVSNVTDMHSMFFENFALETLDLSGWNTSKVTIINRMFYGNSNLKTIYVGSSFSLNSVDTSVNDNVYDMFYGCTKLVGGLGTTYNSNFVNHTYAHIDGGTSNPGYFTDAYAGGTLANGFNLSSPLSTNNIESITFQPNITTPSGVIGSFDSSESTDGSVMGYYKDSDSNGKYEVIFASAGKIFAPIDSSYLFAYFGYLTTINGIENLDTSEVENMEGMFIESFVNSVDFSNFDTSNVTTMAAMFAYSSFTTLDLSNWDTSNVTDMSEMFSDCSATTINISGWDTTNLSTVNSMFSGCINLTTIYSDGVFVVPTVANGVNMFNGATNLRGDQGTTYSSSHTGKDYAHVDGGTSDPGYFSSGGSSGAKSVNNSMGAKTVSKTSNNIADTSKAILNKIDEIVKKENN